MRRAIVRNLGAIASPWAVAPGGPARMLGIKAGEFGMDRADAGIGGFLGHFTHLLFARRQNIARRSVWWPG